MGKLPDTYTVHASVTPDGRVERTNVLVRRVYYKLQLAYSDHDKWRWLVVNKTDDPTVWIIDLWNTEQINDHPYVKPHFLQERFTTVDQAIGFIALNV